MRTGRVLHKRMAAHLSLCGADVITGGGTMMQALLCDVSEPVE